MYQLKEITPIPSTEEQKEQIIIIKILKFGGGTYVVEAHTSATDPYTGTLRSQEKGPVCWC